MVSTGLEGLRVARHSSPGLILLDLRLPDGSGFDFCRQMRQAGLHQPVIMLTAQREEMDKVLGLETGADDYVTKPFHLRELLSRIRSQLRRANGEFSQANTDLLHLQDVTLDLARGEALRGGQPLSLTPTEYRLLVFLVRNRGRALTRSQIIEAVWGYTPEFIGNDENEDRPAERGDHNADAQIVSDEAKPIQEDGCHAQHANYEGVAMLLPQEPGNGNVKKTWPPMVSMLATTMVKKSGKTPRPR